MPHLSAVFSPTVTPMLRVGAPGVSGWLSGMKPDTEWDMLSSPPAMTTVSIPAMPVRWWHG